MNCKPATRANDVALVVNNPHVTHRAYVTSLYGVIFETAAQALHVNGFFNVASDRMKFPFCPAAASKGGAHTWSSATGSS